MNPTIEPQPFFVASGKPPRDARRLLLISHHFPPDTGAGALRWQKLAGHLSARGWAIDVVTQDPATLAAREDARLHDLPAGTRVFAASRETLMLERLEHAAWRVYRTLRPLREPQGARGGPSAPGGHPDREPARPAGQRARAAVQAWLGLRKDLAWGTAAAAVAERVLDPSAHRAVVTCGPPHMVHEAGRRLARRAGLPHVADLRDPWSQVERLPEVIDSAVWRRGSAFYERRVVRDAALVVMNTEPARDAMRARYPEAADRIEAVLNGCDDEPVPARRGSRFVVAYAGTIYLDRDPRLLLRAAARVIAERGLEPDAFGIELMGNVESYAGESVASLAEAEGIHDHVALRPRGTRAEALDFLSRASLLVSLPQDSHMAIPSKVYEYMQFEAWLLALAEPRSATARLLAGSAADVVLPGDVDGIAAVLRRRYDEHVAGRTGTRLAAEPRFGRAAQAGRLVDALERVLAPRPAASPRAAPPTADAGTPARAR
jgi:glycosyltransferase involved in cell wall biosynthesis